MVEGEHIARRRVSAVLEILTQAGQIGAVSAHGLRAGATLQLKVGDKALDLFAHLSTLRGRSSSSKKSLAYSWLLVPGVGVLQSTQSLAASSLSLPSGMRQRLAASVPMSSSVVAVPSTRLKLCSSMVAVMAPA